MRPRRRSSTTPFSQISVVVHSAEKQVPMTKRATNQTIRSSESAIAAKESSDRPNWQATSRRSPILSISFGRNGPKIRMPAPASEALSPISQVAMPLLSSASEKNG
jgi:hypothetical protein